MPLNQVLSVSFWTDMPEDAVRRRLRKALATEGLEIVGEIEASKLIKADTGLLMEECSIIGVWSSLAAYHALLASPEVAVALPFQIVVASYHGGTMIAATNPRRLEQFFDKLSFRLLAVEVYGKLKRALASVAPPGVQPATAEANRAIGW
jgi:uncharacterized protein (DUF302 family)